MSRIAVLLGLLAAGCTGEVSGGTSPAIDGPRGIVLDAPPSLVAVDAGPSATIHFIGRFETADPRRTAIRLAGERDPHPLRGDRCRCRPPRSGRQPLRGGDRRRRPDRHRDRSGTDAAHARERAARRAPPPRPVPAHRVVPGHDAVRRRVDDGPDAGHLRSRLCRPGFAAVGPGGAGALRDRRQPRHQRLLGRRPRTALRRRSDRCSAAPTSTRPPSMCRRW